MASNEISARVKIDGAKEAAKDLQDVGKEAQKLDGETVELGVKVDDGGASTSIGDLISKVDRLDGKSAQLLLKSNASAITGEIADVVAKLDRLDANDPQVDIEVANLGRLQGDLETIEAKIREVDGRRAALEVTADTGAARSDLDQVQAKVREIDGTTATVEVGADTSAFTSAIGSLPGALGSITTALGTGGTVATGVGAIGAGLLAAADYAADVAVQAEVMSTLTGDSVENAAKLQAVWQTSGADINDLNDVLLQMNGVLIDSPEYAKQLHINLKDGKTIGERFVEVVDKIGESTLGASAKAKLMSAVFGEEGVRQVAALQASIEGPLSSAIENAPALVDEEDVEAAQEFKRQIAELKTEFSQAAAELGQNLLPLLTRAAEAAAAITAGLPGGDAPSLINPMARAKEIDAFLAESRRKFDEFTGGNFFDEFTGGDFGDKTAAELAKIDAAAEESARKWDQLKESIEQLAVELTDANAALGDMVTPFETIGRNQDALKSVFDLGNAPEVAAGKVRDVKLAIGELDTALEGIDVADVLSGDIKADKFLDAIDAIAPDIQAQITDTFAAAGPGAAIAMANSYIDQVTAELDGKFTREQVAQMLGLEDIIVKVGVAIDQSTLELARQRLEILAGVPGADPIWVAEMKLKLQDPTADVTALAAEIDAMLEGAGVEVPIGADTLAAVAKADAAKAYADGLVGTETFDGEWSLAKARADAAKAYADALVGTETIDGDEEQAKAKADAAKVYADALAAILTFDGDNQPAKDEADAAKAYADGLSAAITVDAKKGAGWDSLKNFFAGGITATVNATAGGRSAALSPTPTAGPTVTALGPTALAGPTVTPAAVPIGSPAGMAAVQVAAIWEDILRAVNRLGTLTEDGNDTAKLASRALEAINLEDVGVEQANRIGALLEQLNYETVAGNKEAMDALSTELSVAVRELNPAAAATAPAAAVAAEVVKAEAAQAKEDPNTAILEQISNTLLGIASWDKTANSILVGEVKYLAQVVQAAGGLDPSIVRGAVMAIGAGAA